MRTLPLWLLAGCFGQPNPFVGEWTLLVERIPDDVDGDLCDDFEGSPDGLRSLAGSIFAVAGSKTDVGIELVDGDSVWHSDRGTVDGDVLTASWAVFTEWDLGAEVTQDMTIDLVLELDGGDEVTGEIEYEVVQDVDGNEDECVYVWSLAGWRHQVGGGW